MPVYKYECESCGHTFEDLRGINEANPEACPECSASTVKRLISGGNFHLKGSGWYATDYASSDAPKSEGAPSDGASDGDEAA